MDFRSLYKKGYRGIICDLDNTLVEHDADASDEAKELYKTWKDIGFEVCYLSNNDKERVERFNEGIKAHSIYDGKKPLPGNYKKAMKLMGTNKKNTIFIGDQIFTDTLGANIVGIKNILVDPISPKEERLITIKRFFEKIVLKGYERKRTKAKK